jgi:hypothetical protein
MLIAPARVVKTAFVVVIASGLAAMGLARPAEAASLGAEPEGIQGTCSQSVAKTHEEAAPLTCSPKLIQGLCDSGRG